jgi:hypothetical protein
MKTHRTAGAGRPPLPPAPAPPAKDANPWPMPEQLGDRPSAPRTDATPSRTQPKPPFRNSASGTRLSAEAREPGASPPAGAAMRQPGQEARGRSPLATGVPLLIVLGALVGGVLAAREALASGDVVAAIVPLLIVGVVAFNLLRRSRRR